MNTSSIKSYSKILVTGGDGQVASALKKAAKISTGNVIFCDRQQADITSLASLENAINHHMPDVIINTAAYTAVDQAEKQIEECMLINHIGASHLANVCQQHKIPLIHLSTDYVFDGSKKIAYVENDEINPINVYGKSKWLGEETIRQACKQHVIIRVSGVFSEYKKNFLKTILNLAQQNKRLRIVSDQLTCPTYAGDIATMLLIIAKNPHHTGTFHYCSDQPVSWHGFASEIIRQTESMVIPVDPISSAEFPTPAKRPHFAVLDCRKITKEYAVIQPSWKAGIRNALTYLKNVI